MKVTLLIFALAMVLGVGVSRALAVIDCGPCAGRIAQDCTTGGCSGGAAKVQAECMEACCYGSGNSLCGAREPAGAPIP